MTDRASTVPPCNACKPGEEFPFGMTTGFQPIVDARARTVFAYEALMRDIDTDPVRQAIVRGIMGACAGLHIEVIAEPGLRVAWFNRG